MTSSYDASLEITGEGPPLVLVPGMNGSGRLFYAQIPRLAQRYRVATYRLRDTAESLDRLADDLLAVVGHVAPGGRAIIVGESFGGAVALTFALRHPARVERLVILNSFAHFTPQLRLQAARVALRLLPWQTMRLVRHLTAWRLHSGHTHRAEVRRFIDLTTDATREGYLNRLRLLLTYDVRARLRTLDLPVLYLAATEDHLVPSVAQARLMAGETPGSTLQLLHGHGHICLIAPDLDLAAIIDAWRADRGEGGDAFH